MNNVLQTLHEQHQTNMHGGIYHRTQIEMAYNSNHIEGSRLTHEQTRYIYETNTIGMADGEGVNVDDIVETVNHFRCLDMVIEQAEEKLSETLIKNLHRILKTGTSDNRHSWFAVGEYKQLPNEVGGLDTTSPNEIGNAMCSLLDDYPECPELNDILDFHVRFERIHPFQDGNGRVGRLIMFKECLRSGIVPFIISDDMKFYYYRGLSNWPNIPGYFTDTCLTAQDRYKALLDKFQISY